MRFLGLIALVAFAALVAGRASSETPAKAPPATLSETGLYADAATLSVDPNHIAFTPQYQLWTDGAQKSRWISVPAGSVIDGADPDAWVFPIGTRFWKQFDFDGRRVETRYMELTANGAWLYAAYAWSEDQRDAVLVAPRGQRGYRLAGGGAHDIPGTSDCRVCHEGQPSAVLGFSSLQLSADRDPGALRGEASPADLQLLVERGLVVNVPDLRPSIAAASATERAALGYLHGNCGHCHNSRGSLSNVEMVLKQEFFSPQASVLSSIVGHAVHKAAPGQSKDAVLRVVAGVPEHSALLERVSSRYPALQMPPLGTANVDAEAVDLLRRWIAGLDPAPAQPNIEGQK